MMNVKMVLLTGLNLLMNKFRIMAGSVGRLHRLVLLLSVGSVFWLSEAYGGARSIEIRSYFKNDMIFFEIFNGSKEIIVINQAPWHGEHQPYFLACRKPDFLHCINSSMTLSTAWPYKYQIESGETIGGGIYIDDLFIGSDELILSGNYVVMWYFESDYGNYTGVVKKN